MYTEGLPTRFQLSSGATVDYLPIVAPDTCIDPLADDFIYFYEYYLKYLN